MNSFFPLLGQRAQHHCLMGLVQFQSHIKKDQLELRVYQTPP